LVEEYDGIPVIVYTVGSYPKLVDESGKEAERYIEIVKCQKNANIWGKDGREVKQTDEELGVYYSVGVFAGWLYGRGMSLGIGRFPDMAGAKNALPQAAEALDGLPALYDRYYALLRGIGPYDNGPISRAEYESLAAEYGFQPIGDNKIDSYGNMYLEYAFPEYPLEDLPRLWANQRRCWAINRENDEKAETSRKEAENKRAEAMKASRNGPVARVVELLMPKSEAFEFTKGGEVWTPIKRGRETEIDSDMPSYEGSHLLGHEGEAGVYVTFEVREIAE